MSKDKKSFTLADIWYLIFHNISQATEKRELKYQEFQKELEEKLSNLPDNQIIQPDIHIAKQIPSDQIKDTHSLLLNDDEDKIQYHLNIYKNFHIESISHVATDKYVTDPLGNPISDIKNIQIDVKEVNDELLKLLHENPNYLYQLSSRKFEEVIAEIFCKKGYNVKLTPATRDGGKDLYVARKDDIGSLLYIVECKKYNPNNKVGVSVLRELYGVVSKENATRGIIATTSYFTKPAQEFQQEIPYRMSLKDFDAIKQWLYEVTHHLQ